MSGFLSLFERLNSTINTLILEYFDYKWYNTFTLQVSSLITAEFLLFIKSQFTTNVENILHLNQLTHRRV